MGVWCRRGKWRGGGRRPSQPPRPAHPPGPQSRLGVSLPPAVVAGRTAAVRSGRLVRFHLPGGARAAVPLGALEGRPAERQADPQLDPPELRTALQRTRLPDDRLAHDRHRGGGDGHRRRARGPVRVLRSARAAETAAGRAVHRRADPALVELPRAGLRLAADPRQRGHPQLAAGRGGARVGQPRLLELGDVAGLQLHLAAVHDPAGVVGGRTRAGLDDRGFCGPRRPRLADVPERDLPADPARDRSWVDLHFRVDARRLHHADARRGRGFDDDRQRRLQQRRGRQQRAVRGRLRGGAAGGHGPVPAAGPAAGSVRSAVTGTSRGRRIALGVFTALLVGLLFFPIVIIMVYAFNPSNIQSWPLPGLSTRWFSPTWHNAEMRHALWLSVRAGLLSTAIAVLLGSMAAFAVHRFRFFGREAISFLIVLPIALPGIITGMALNSFISFGGVEFGLLTIIVGHATFCIVVVYNNVLARLRRTSSSLVEASMDLGADGLQTFRYVTLPMIATALVAGGLLAFALSFDEIVVTTFTAGAQSTLPIWIFGNIRLGQQLPQVNVVVLFVILLSLIPVALAQRLTRDTGLLRRGAPAPPPAPPPSPRPPTSPPPPTPPP